MTTSCLLCLEMNTETLAGIRTGSTKWRELNIADTIEKHFWPLNTYQSSTWICLPCWEMVKDFHNFYLRIEEAHMKFKVIKVEKEEILEFNFEEMEIFKEKPRKDFAQLKTHAGPENVSLEFERTEDTGADVINDSVDASDGYRRSRLDDYASDSDISDDDYDYQEDPNSAETANSEKNLPTFSFGLKSKCKNNDKFIAEHFKPMNCDICHEPFSDFCHMKKHFSNIHNQRGYVVCCKRKFYDRFHLVDHLHLHLNPNHFKCNHCGKTMSDRRTIKRHIMFEHLGNVEDNCYQCDACDISFKEEYLLRIHKSVHLPTGEKEFPCSDCAETYDSFYPLFQHLKDAHLKKFFRTCYVCGKSIICSRDFEAHINKHEGRPHTMVYCDVCGLGLTTESGLRRHQKSQHPADGKKEYPCPNCPKISPTLKAIRKHINTMHTASFNHKCEICERMFKRKSVLKEHMAAHTGTPLYSCPWCPKTFYSNGNMHAHRKRVHPKEWEVAKLQKYSEDFQPIIASSIS